MCTNIGTWNVRSMNQGKLERVKQEMTKVNVYILGISKLRWTGMGEFKSDVVKDELTRVNINILGISELKWTGMGEYNSEDHYICYCGQRIPLKKLIRPHSQQKSLKRST